LGACRGGKGEGRGEENTKMKRTAKGLEEDEKAQMGRSKVVDTVGDIFRPETAITQEGRGLEDKKKEEKNKERRAPNEGRSGIIRRRRGINHL